VIHRPVAAHYDSKAAAQRRLSVAEHIPCKTRARSQLDRRGVEEMAVVLMNAGKRRPVGRIRSRVESALSNERERRTGYRD
jgi:hypothetical protein